MEVAMGIDPHSHGRRRLTNGLVRHSMNSWDDEPRRGSRESPRLSFDDGVMLVMSGHSRMIQRSLSQRPGECCLADLSKRGSQRRGRCPVHAQPGDRDRSFSADLQKNVFQCFHPQCGIHGNVLDFWAAWRR
ncbi:MAG: CHC2 zinc finger domain-containing protein, partial [Candidatus Saccharimonadales bacterium]